MTSKLTREELLNIIETDHVQCGEASYLARMALAAMDSEPVYQFIYNNPYEEGYTEWLDCNKDYFNGVPEDCRRVLYAAPPAQDRRTITQHFDTIALETAREILCDVNRRHEFIGGDVQLLSRLQCRIDEACRVAMLNGDKP